jgi:HSP20 family protein
MNANDWSGYVEKWFNTSSIDFADHELDTMRQELLIGFDKLTEEFDKIFNDDLNEFKFLESYMEVRSETVREEVDVLLYGSYPLNLRPNKNTRVSKIRRIKPVSVQRRNHTDDDDITGSKRKLSRIEKEEGRESLEDVIVTDKNVRVVTQLPINNRRENIRVVAYSDNSVTISHLNSEGKRCRSTSVIPYKIDIETARSTYKNGILEITFNRK